MSVCCTLPYCCCGCSLRTGILFAGWYGLAASLIGFIGVILSILSLSWFHCYVIVQIGVSALTCFTVTSLFKGILTLYGIHKDDLSILLVSAYLHLFLGVFVIVGIVVSLIAGFFPVLTFLIDCFINFYSFLVLRSFALELEEKRKNSAALCKI